MTSLEAAAAGIDGVIHAAALVKALSHEDFHRANAIGTQNLIRAITRVAPRLRRFVHVSSLTAVGPSLDGRPVPVGRAPAPVTHYGVSKLAGEDLIRGAADDFPVTIIRPPMIYGPRDREVFAFFRSVKAGILPLINSPDTVLSAVFVTDCAAACVAALRAETPSGTPYFVDDGRPATLRNRIADIEQAVGRTVRVKVQIPRSILFGAALAAQTFGWITRRPVMLTRNKLNELLAPHWVCDSADAQAALDWQPKIHFSEGAQRAAAWYRQAGWL
jgi:nucleoside-diphosphate-sugar epimerase